VTTHAQATLVAVATTLTMACCTGRTEKTTMQADPDPNDDKVAAFSKELHAVAEPIGDGGRDYYPYELRSDVMAAVKKLGPHPLDVYQALLTREHDPLYLETLIFLVGRTDDARADDVLLGALAQPALRPRALYALGAMGTRNWPHRNATAARGSMPSPATLPTPRRTPTCTTAIEPSRPAISRAPRSCASPASTASPSARGWPACPTIPRGNPWGLRCRRSPPPIARGSTPPSSATAARPTDPRGPLIRAAH